MVSGAVSVMFTYDGNTAWAMDQLGDDNPLVIAPFTEDPVQLGIHVIDTVWEKGIKNVCWLGIGGTWASAMQAVVHMKERSALEIIDEDTPARGKCRQKNGTCFVPASGAGEQKEREPCTLAVHGSFLSDQVAAAAPLRPWHCLYFFPLPQGQGSLG